MEKTNIQQSRAIFGFLKEMQRLRNKPVKKISTYATAPGHWVYHLDDTIDTKKGGAIQESVKLNSTDGINSGIESVNKNGITNFEETKKSILTIKKTTPPESPKPSAELGPWIDGDIDSIYDKPQLLAIIELKDQSNEQILTRMDIKDHPNLADEFKIWLDKWEQWSIKYKDEINIRKLYTKLHETREKLRDQSQDWEFILGIGRLRLGLRTDKEIDRHIFTVPCIIDLDPNTATLFVKVDETAYFVVEDDWIKGFKKPQLADLETVRDLLNTVDDLTDEKIKKEFIKLAHKLKAEIVTEDNEVDFEIKDSLLLSPSLILRKRGKQDLIKMLESIEDLFKVDSDIPAPLQSLLEPGYAEKSSSSDWSGDGAVVSVEDGYQYLPLTLNSKQLKALELADTRNATIIQGPPGTGKTRTIAVMVSHFLAKGQRVLVAAQTPQALREVRSQLPDNIRDLAVASLGGGKSDNDDLQKAVNALVAAHEDRTELIDGFDKFEKEQLESITELHAKRAGLIRKIIDIRVQGSNLIEVEGQKGSPGHLALVHLDQRAEYSWLSEISDPRIEAPMYTVSDAQFIVTELRKIWQTQLEISSDLELLPKEEIWTDKSFQEAEKLHLLIKKSDIDLQLPIEETEELIRLLEPAIELQNIIKVSNPPWLEKAISATNTFNEHTFIVRLKNAQKALETLDYLLNQMGQVSEFECGKTSIGWLPILDKLKERVSSKGPLKTSETGSIKKSIIQSKLIKKASSMLDEVKILGKSPNTTEDFDRIVGLVKFDDLFKNYIVITEHTPQDISKNRYSQTIWLSEQSKVIKETLALNTANMKIKEFLKMKLPKTDVHLHKPLDLVVLYNAALAKIANEDFKKYNSELSYHIAKLEGCFQNNEPEFVSNYVRDVKGMNFIAFNNSRMILNSYIDQLDLKKNLVKYIRNLSDSDHMLIEAAKSWINEELSENKKAEIILKVNDLVNAFKWKRLGDTLGNKEIIDYGKMLNEVTRSDTQIEKKVSELASRRSWKKALDRIDAKTISNMESYSLESRKLGAGTGVTAARRRRDIRKILTDCMPAVPAWIMPIDRVAQLFTAQLEMFDVVIVDEASQARLDSLFLLALSKRVVIVGDHKQVSPDGGMVSDADIEQIIDRHLVDNDPRKANWRNSDLSLFDECKVSFGNMVTLTEHRRCVPEIIGFSNQIAYEPENIRLVPVRLTGTNALSPIKTIFVENGFVRGSSGLEVNQPEAEAVAQEVLRMVKDSAYRNMTIGVVTLQGSKQQEIIRTRLLDLVPAAEMEARQIRVGMPPDFQGSERNVILISMVMAPNQKFVAQTKELMVQRYNVATSRAKDQMVLVHSLATKDINNTSDLRRQLIDYCQRIEHGLLNPVMGTVGLVSNDVEVEPFESLFEQRVHNRIVGRGYKVIPQFPPVIEGHNYRIDLVVVGPYGKYAIECDGDFWHGGQEAFEKDLIRQEILQRCGWKFFRIPESRFYGEPDYLDQLWPELDKFVSAKNIEVLTLSNEISNHTIGKESLIIDTTDEKEIYKEFDIGNERPKTKIEETSSDKNQIGKNSSPRKKKKLKKKSLRQPLNDDADLWTKLEFYNTSVSKYDSLNDENTTSQLTVESVENPWNEGELKSIKKELMEDLKLISNALEIFEADAGGKTFEIEHEKSLVYNARDLVQQIEWALDRIKNNTYGKCQECDNFIGKARLKVFPRATLCMLCKS